MAKPAGGLDTNVLVRYLIADDPAQFEAARDYIETACTPDAPGLIHPVMLCELVWVLGSGYRVPKAEIVAALDTLLHIRSLRVLEAETVRDALALYQTHAADFADALLHVAYQKAGAAGLVTFDKKACTLPDTRSLQ